MLGRVVMHPEGRDLLPAALLAAAEHDVGGLLGIEDVVTQADEPILAAATGVECAAEVVGGHYIARVQIPRRLWHPSLQPETVAGHAGQVTALDEVVGAANAEQSG